MREERLKIQGMTCETCARRIEQALARVDGVTDCRVDFSRGTAWVRCGDETARQDLCRAVEASGYGVTEGPPPVIQQVSFLVILLAAYLAADHLGLMGRLRAFPTAETAMSRGAVFVIGLLTSVHCVAMCGGIHLAQNTLAARRREGAVRSAALYNLGRVLAYTALGGAAGALGSVITVGGRMKGLAAVLAGSAMVMMALRMLGICPALRALRLPAGAYRLTGRLGNWLGKGRSSLFIGLLNGLMPCGPLQSMQLYALSTGSVWEGALSMLLFGLGTVPLMLAFGTLFGVLTQKRRHAMLTVSALLVFLLGVGMVGNGLLLSGAALPAAPAGGEAAAVMEGERQFVRSEVDHGSYEPIVVRRGIAVEWTIYVPEGHLNGCNEELLVPRYGLDLRLREGENHLTFTPEETGTVPFTCWMGMIKSSIRVVE